MRKLAKFILTSVLFALPCQTLWAQSMLPPVSSPQPAKMQPVGKVISEDAPVWGSETAAAQKVGDKSIEKSVSNSSFDISDTGCAPGCATGCCTKHEGHSFSVFGEFLYLQPRGADVHYGQAFDGVGPLAVPRDGVGRADPDFSAGFRVGGGLYLNECSWVTVSFAWLDSTTNSDLVAAPGTAIHSFITYPNQANSAADSSEANAHYEIDFRIIDVDFHHTLWGGCSQNYQVSYLVGLRYAHLDQDLTSHFSILGDTTVVTNINFDGIGPRAGLEGEYRLGCGLFGYSKGTLDVLAGHFGGSYEQKNIFTGLQAHTDVGDDRVVPQLELEVGIGWAGHGDHIRVSAGYYVGAWYNTMTTNSLFQSIQGNAATSTNFTTNASNWHDALTFDGFVARIEFRY